MPTSRPGPCQSGLVGNQGGNVGRRGGATGAPEAMSDSVAPQGPGIAAIEAKTASSPDVLAGAHSLTMATKHRSGGFPIWHELCVRFCAHQSINLLEDSNKGDKHDRPSPHMVLSTRWTALRPHHHFQGSHDVGQGQGGLESQRWGAPRTLGTHGVIDSAPGWAQICPPWPWNAVRPL